MADDKLDISSIFGDTFKQISDALSGETQKKKTTRKKTTAKKSTSTKTSSALSSAGLKAAKLGGNCYVVVNEKKIYNEDGKSVSLFS